MINLLYISISGNTRAFAQRLTHYAEAQHEVDSAQPLIHLTEISDASQAEGETAPYFVMIPTYLDGGNGIDNGFNELMTTAMGDYMREPGNAAWCRGIIGSGNRNFNEQYCLTAKEYCREVDVPFLADYELRGNAVDAKRIYEILVQTSQADQAK